MSFRPAWPQAAEWLCCMLFGTTVCGPALADPMRPLRHVAAPVAAATAETAPGTQALAAPPSQRLTAIRQDSAGRRTALFGQSWLQVGDKLVLPDGQATVQRIGEHQVDLRRPRGSETIYLLQPLLPSPLSPPPDTAHGPAGPRASDKIPHSPASKTSRTQGSGTS